MRALVLQAAGGFGLRLAGAGAGFLTNVVLARLLGPEDYGALALVMAMVALGAMAAGLGLPTYATREIARAGEEGRRADIAGHALFSLLVSFLVAMALAGGAALLWPMIAANSPSLARVPTGGIIAAAGLLVLYSLAFPRAAVLRGRHQPVRADIPELAIRPFAVLLLIGAGVVGLFSIGLETILVAYLAATTLAGLVGAVLLVRAMPGFAPVNWPRGWSSSAPFFWLIGLVGLVLMQLPLYLLGLEVNTSQTGIYAISMQFAAVVQLAITSVEVSVQARLAAAGGQGRETMQRQVDEAGRLGLLAALLLALAIFLLAPVFSLVLGERYAEIAGVLRVLLIGQLLYALCGPARVLLSMTGHERIVLAAVSVALAGALLAGLAVIPEHGALGAAAIAAASTAFVNLFLLVVCWRRLGVRTFPFGRPAS